MSGPVVELSHVFCVHRSGQGDVAALQGLELTLGAGEVLAVLGPSGAGKSTLLRVIAGVQVPTAGVVAVLGRDIGRLPARERVRLRKAHIGFVGQRVDAAAGEAVSVARIIELPLALRGVSRLARRARVAELLTAVGLADRAGARLPELSGGERQRVALCSALAHRPALLLADEPSAELDDAAAATMRDLITALSRVSGASAVITSHDPEMARAADRVIVLRDGRVVETRQAGTSATVIAKGGWVPVPAALLTEAGIGATARVRIVDGGVRIESASVGVEHASAVEPVAAPDRPPASVRPGLVEARAVSHFRGRGEARRAVIDERSVSFPPGVLTAITGRSGSGKTTLLRLLAGLEPPDRGEVLIDGHSLRGTTTDELASLRRTRIAYLSQEPAPVHFLSAAENIVMVLQLRGLNRPEALARAAAALGRVGLGERARQPAGRLSAGEAQRLGLARAMACSTGLLLLDEPTSRLDRESADDVALRLEAAAAEDGHTVICATHDPEVVARASHIVRLG